MAEMAVVNCRVVHDWDQPSSRSTIDITIPLSRWQYRALGQKGTVLPALKGKYWLLNIKKQDRHLAYSEGKSRTASSISTEAYGEVIEEFNTVKFDKSLDKSLQLCDLFLNNAKIQSSTAQEIAQICSFGSGSLMPHTGWRGYIRRKLHEDESWHSGKNKWPLVKLLFDLGDESVENEIKAEIRRDPDCTAFGGFPWIIDDELRLYVMRSGKPEVAAPLFEVRFDPDWNHKLLSIALKRLGEDIDLDRKLMVIAAQVIKDSASAPANIDQWGQFGRADRDTMVSGVKNAIKKFLAKS